MNKKFTQAFKIQAVEKALIRSKTTTLEEVAESFGVGYSTLQKWINQSRSHEFEASSDNELKRSTTMTKEKRPHDWSLSERLEMVIACGLLDENANSELCRKKGIYLHHVKQWKIDFIDKNIPNNRAEVRSEIKSLKSKNQILTKELNRKEKALAETAALLVLQKKVSEIWRNDEERLQ